MSQPDLNNLGELAELQKKQTSSWNSEKDLKTNSWYTISRKHTTHNYEIRRSWWIFWKIGQKSWEK